MNLKKEFSWIDFNRARQGFPARETLLFALKKFSEEGKTNATAFDIGCGPGNDAAELLSKGWSVTATDNNPDILNYFGPLLNQYKNKLEVQITSFEEIIWKKTDLVNASFTLPFCPKEHFKFLWDNITSSIKSKGRFSGQFFGKKDEWKELIRHSRKEVVELFSGFDLELLGEIVKDDKTSTGAMKHWHLFNIVARKK